MKTLYVRDLVPGTVINRETFAIVDKKITTDKNGTQFYDLVLADKTGQIGAKIWYDSFGRVDRKAVKTGNVVAIDATVNEFKGAPQLVVLSLYAVDETKLEEYLESSKFSADEMFAELQQIVDQRVTNHHLKSMLQAMLADETVSRKLKYWPAANSYHHEFRSGLLQHKLECLSLAQSLERFYPEADFSVVYAGIIMHDIGKLDELDASGIVTRYTVKGSALSHIYIGTQYVDKYLSPEAPENLRVHIKHIVLSHNGDKEKGAPVEPITLEAGLVSVIDEASSMANQFAKGMQDEHDEHGMTGFNRWLKRGLWATRNNPDASVD